MLLLKLSTHLTLIFLIYSFFSIQLTQSFNPRITCIYNKLLFNSRYTNWKYYLLRSPATMSIWNQLTSNEKLGVGQQHAATSNITNISYVDSSLSLTNCRNWLMNNQSCCNNQDFQNFANNVNRAFDIVLNNTLYPIVQYLYNLVGNLTANNCLFTKIYLPGMSGYNSNYDSQPVNIVVKQMMDLVNKIALNQRMYINQTMCLVCLGVKDYTNFIYPNYAYLSDPLGNYLILQRNYFLTRVNNITSYLMQIENLHSNLSSYVFGVSNSVPGSASAACLSVKNGVKSQVIDGLRLCTDSGSCRAVAVKYFGQIISPQLMMYINQLSLGLGMWVQAGYYCISNDPQYGFKGNTSYKGMYGNMYFPNVTIYNYTDLWAGL